MAMVIHDQDAQPEVAGTDIGPPDQQDEDDVHMIALEIQRGREQGDKSLAMVEMTAVKFRAMIETPEFVHQAHRDHVRRALEEQGQEFTQYVNLLRAQYLHLGESASAALGEARHRLANGEAELREARARIVVGTNELAENNEHRQRLQQENETLRKQTNELAENNNRLQTLQRENETLRKQVHDFAETIARRDDAIEKGNRANASLQEELDQWRNTAENCKEALRNANRLQDDLQQATGELQVVREERRTLQRALEEANNAGRRLEKELEAEILEKMSRSASPLLSQASGSSMHTAASTSSRQTSRQMKPTPRMNAMETKVDDMAAQMRELNALVHRLASPSAAAPQVLGQGLGQQVQPVQVQGLPQGVPHTPHAHTQYMQTHSTPLPYPAPMYDVPPPPPSTTPSMGYVGHTHPPHGATINAIQYKSVGNLSDYPAFAGEPGEDPVVFLDRMERRLRLKQVDPVLWATVAKEVFPTSSAAANWEEGRGGRGDEIWAGFKILFLERFTPYSKREELT